MEESTQQVISKQRVADHGEVLTARREVDAMLDLVKSETERIDSTFLEPACGTGNFLIAILERKLAVLERKFAEKEKMIRKSLRRPGWKAREYAPQSLLALSSIYGIDILHDSIEAAKARLLTYYIETYQRIVELPPPAQLIECAKFILDKNILLGDAINTHDKVSIPGIPGLDEIVFIEWKLIGENFKRRAYQFHTMIQDWVNAADAHEAKEQDLFALPQPETHRKIKREDGSEGMEPVPLKEYPMVHYLDLTKGENHE